MHIKEPSVLQQKWNLPLQNKTDYPRYTHAAKRPPTFDNRNHTSRAREVDVLWLVQAMANPTIMSVTASVTPGGNTSPWLQLLITVIINRCLCARYPFPLFHLNTVGSGARGGSHHPPMSPISPYLQVFVLFVSGLFSIPASMFSIQYACISVISRNFSAKSQCNFPPVAPSFLTSLPLCTSTVFLLELNSPFPRGFFSCLLSQLSC
jgi:hypothetical protein